MVLKKIINVWDYKQEYRNFRTQILKSVDRVFKSGSLILGNEVKNFENNFSKFVDCRYGIGVNSGTDAILIAIMSLGLGKGDEILTVSNTAVPTVSAITSAGCKPVFVDISEDDYLIDISLIKKKITSRTKAIVLVNLYGQVPNFREILKIARSNNLKIIEDCAQSTGSYFEGKHSGSFGDISAFSFYPTKNLGAYGDGGMITTNNRNYFKKSLMLRKYGMKKLYYSEMHGINSRLDEVQAAIINLKLNYLKSQIKKRRAIAKKYNDNIKNPDVTLPKEFAGRYHSYYVYVIRHPKRKNFMNYLKNNGVYCNISYPYPIHLMRGYKYLGYKKGDLPMTEKLAKEIFSLPMYPNLNDKSVNKVIKLINNFIL